MMKRKKIYFFGIIVVLALVAMLLSKYYVQVMLIQGASMKPTYHNMSIVFVDKHTRKYGVGDIVVFKADGAKGNLVKRIVAGPKDTVLITDGVLYVNGQPSAQQPNDKKLNHAGIAQTTVTVPDNCYFVLGDNYEESIDSRNKEIGFIAYEAIKGKVIR